MDGSLLHDRQIDYVRQDPLTFALSFNALNHLRVYGELRLGDTAQIFKPKFISDEAVADGYRARELEVGAELSLPIPYVGDFTVAFDMTLHEMGNSFPRAVEPSSTASMRSIHSPMKKMLPGKRSSRSCWPNRSPRGKRA